MYTSISQLLCALCLVLTHSILRCKIVGQGRKKSRIPNGSQGPKGEGRQCPSMSKYSFFGTRSLIPNSEDQANSADQAKACAARHRRLTRNSTIPSLDRPPHSKGTISEVGSRTNVHLQSMFPEPLCCGVPLMSAYQLEVRFRPAALQALQEAAEAYLTEILEHANAAAVHAKRVTVQQKDLRFVCRIRGDLKHQMSW